MSLQVLTHEKLSTSSIRPHGMPPSECGGVLTEIIASDGDNASGDVLGGLMPIPETVEAQPGEGGIADTVEFQLFECEACGNRIPTVILVDGRRRIRNDYARP